MYIHDKQIQILCSQVRTTARGLFYLFPPPYALRYVYSEMGALHASLDWTLTVLTFVP